MNKKLKTAYEIVNDSLPKIKTNWKEYKRSELIGLICEHNPKIEYSKHVSGGGFVQEKFEWNCSKLGDLSNEELYQLYKQLEKRKISKC